MTEDQLEQETLAWPQNVGYNLRDTLLPRLISGQLRLPEVRHLMEDAA